ncbi:zinc finger BED domain-containing protein 1-like [Dendronephthya gigantea]|uniref:zinc finger BED domain-containing protein 1-like n=1 Tax=Dendronephthya gigantea TaxID=151771 RepID=UPI00106D7A42|nr:zinc finger BED domain-containing protein 1-like [Dendronephthya gigantea]
MTELLKDWDLDVKKQVCVTTDNGSNIIKATRDLEWPHLSCFGHNLHLGITKFIDNDRRLKRSLGLAHSIVAQFNYSWKKRRDLTALQVKENKTPKALVSDCRTRWGSTYAMLEQIGDNIDAIRDIMKADRKTKHLIPTWQDKDCWEAISKALRPVAALTDLLSGQNYVTVSSLKILYWKLEKMILAHDENDPELTNDLRAAIMAEILEKAQKMAESLLIINMSSFLDPRYKADCLSNLELEEVKSELIDEIVANEPTVVPEETLQETPSPAKKQRTMTLASFLGNIKPNTVEQQRNSERETPRQKSRKEIDSYLSTSSLDLISESGVETEPLAWWRDHCRDFPLLAKRARKYLCIQASSSPSERLFSKAGQVITPQRTQLNPEKANMLVFLAENL